MRKIINEEEFLTLKNKLINSYAKIDDFEYLSLQNKLLSYDLSSIPSSFYDGITFIGDESSNISFSYTNANLDFNILKFRDRKSYDFGKVYAVGCNISNLSKLNYFYEKDSFSVDVVEKYSHLFLSEYFDKSFRRKVIENKVTISDLIKMELGDRDNIFRDQYFSSEFINLSSKIGLRNSLFLLNGNNDLLIDFNNIFSSNKDETLTELLEKDIGSQREKVFSLQRKYIMDNSANFMYNYNQHFSQPFINKYKGLFSNSLGYKEIIDYSKDFNNYNLTLLGYDFGPRGIAVNIGYNKTIELLKEYEDFLDALESKIPVPLFLRELNFNLGIMLDSFNNDLIDKIFRKTIIYTLPRFEISTKIEEYEDLFSKFGFKFLEIEDWTLLDMVDDNTIVINKEISDLLGCYGLSNIKSFFSEYDVNDESVRKNLLNILYYPDLPVYYNVSSKKFYELLRRRLVDRNTISYEFLTGNVRKELSDLFISDSAPEELKKLFYTKNLSFTDLHYNESWLPYLDNVYLPCRFVETSTFKNIFPDQLLEELALKYGNAKVLENFSRYALFLNSIDYSLHFTSDFDDYSDFNDYMEDKIYNYIKSYKVYNWDQYFSDEFKDKHNDVFLDNDAPDDLKKLFYKKMLTFDDVKEHPEYVKYLLGKDMNLCFNSFYKPGSSIYDTIVKNFGSSEKTFDFITTFGNRLTEVPIYVSNDYLEELINNNDVSGLKEFIDVQIKKCILSGAMLYRHSDKNILGEEYKAMFLDDDAPDDLKNTFYSGNLTFHRIASNVSWLPYLENVDLKLALSNSMYYYKKEINDFYQLFGEKANKLLLHKAKTIDDMFLRGKGDLIYDWYLKTSSTFIPSSVVMLNFDFNEADRFFEYKKDWAILSKNKRFFADDNKQETLLKMAYIFGVFHGDRKAMNKINSIIYGIPNTLNVDEMFELRNYEKSIISANDLVYSENFTLPPGFSQYNNILECMKSEGLSIDNNESVFFKFYSEKNDYKLNINPYKYPRTIEAIRNFMETVNFEKVLSPSRAHFAFSGLDMKYDPDFRDFILDNLSEVSNDPNYYKRLPLLQERFDNYRHLYRSGNYDLKSLFASLGVGNYNNVESGNIGLAQTVTITGYPEEAFLKLQKVYDYGKVRCYSSIPRVSGKREKFTYEVLKLDDPLALTVGYHTGCCQDIGEAGAWCMVHSMTKDNGRVFVVRDDENNIVAQSWVWRDKNLVCFDDIEFPKSSHFVSVATKKAGSLSNFTDQILEVYKEVANEIIQIDNENFSYLHNTGKISDEEYKLRVSKVTVGKGYNESAAVVNRNLEKDLNSKNPILNDKVPAEFNYGIYSDANEQFILADVKRDDDLSHVDDIFIYKDTYDEYTDKDFNLDRSLVLTLCDLERETKEKNFVTSDILSTNNLCETFSNYYRTRNPAKVMMNPNFAIIYDVSDDGVEVCDLFFNTNMNLFGNYDIEDRVSTQIGNALSQLNSKYGDIKFNLEMNDKQEKMINKSLEKSKEGGEKHGTR